MNLKQETKNKLTAVFFLLMLATFASSVFVEISQPTSKYIAMSILK